MLEIFITCFEFMRGGFFYGAINFSSACFELGLRKKMSVIIMIMRFSEALELDWLMSGLTRPPLVLHLWYRRIKKGGNL